MESRTALPPLLLRLNKNHKIELYIREMKKHKIKIIVAAIILILLLLWIELAVGIFGSPIAGS